MLKCLLPGNEKVSVKSEEEVDRAVGRSVVMKALNDSRAIAEEKIVATSR